jgi:iron complex outermembrane recepter protein
MTRARYRMLAIPPLLVSLTTLHAAVDNGADSEPRIEIIEVTARLRREDAQRVPLAFTVIGGGTLDATNTINVSQLTQLAPSLNFSSPNPRNTALTIRGLGSSVVAVAQANDGLEPGVGFYVDQVYHARPATAVFDFLDLEQVEVLRGPQGTLFGKNTTAGALNISTRKASFVPEAAIDLTMGSYGYEQVRVSVNGPLVDQRMAGRLSLLSNRRDGLLYNIGTGQRQNDVDNQGVRAQLRIIPSDNFTVDVTRITIRSIPTAVPRCTISLVQACVPPLGNIPRSPPRSSTRRHRPALTTASPTSMRRCR